MQQMAEVVERNWLDSSPGAMQEARGQMDTAEAYEVVTRMAEDEMKKFNLQKMTVKIPVISPVR